MAVYLISTNFQKILWTDFIKNIEKKVKL
jgi:hypothetical protein